MVVINIVVGDTGVGNDAILLSFIFKIKKMFSPGSEYLCFIPDFSPEGHSLQIKSSTIFFKNRKKTAYGHEL